jgi:hypothetical protein
VCFYVHLITIVTLAIRRCRDGSHQSSTQRHFSVKIFLVISPTDADSGCSAFQRIAGRDARTAAGMDQER